MISPTRWGGQENGNVSIYAINLALNKFPFRQAFIEPSLCQVFHHAVKAIVPKPPSQPLNFYRSHHLESRPLIQGLMTNLSPFLVYVFVVTFTPGPNNIMAMVNGMRLRYLRMARFLAGIFTGFFIVMLVCGLLNVVLTGLLPSAEHWLKIIGALYMVYLAIHILRSGPPDDSEGENTSRSFKFGFTMQFLNVKVILYGITVFSLFITDTYKDPLTITVFAVLLAAVGFISTSVWAVGGNILRNLVRKNYRIFNFVMAGLLIYTAIASLV